MYILQLKFVPLLLVFGSAAFVAYLAIHAWQSWFVGYQEKYTANTKNLLEELFIFQDPKKVFWVNISISTLFTLIGALLLRDLSLTVLLGVTGYLLPKFLIWSARKRRHEKFAAQFVDCLLVLSNSLRSGMNLTQSIEILERESEAPLSQEFGLVLRENRLGVPIEKALTDMTTRIPNDDLKLMVTAVNIILNMGGNLIEIFDTLAKVIRERTKLEGKTKALTSQGKMQGAVVGLLPTMLGGIMFILDPSSMTLMLTTTIGNIALGVMFILQAAGYLIMLKISSIEV